MEYQRLDEVTILRLADGAYIPATPENRDYQLFLAWEAGRSQATPVDAAPA